MSENSPPQTHPADTGRESLGISAQGVVVRAATPHDWTMIADYNMRLARETEGKMLDGPTVAAGVQAGLADPHRARYFVATWDGVIVGQLMLTTEWSDWRNGTIWWIQSVYVADAYRRRGVFSSLLGHVETLAAAEGAISLRLYVETHNAVAQQTYLRRGFALAGYTVMERPTGIGAKRSSFA